MMADSYKYSHAPMYPIGTTYQFDYMEARGGMYPATIFFGLQAMLMEYFSTPITFDEVVEAQQYATAHGIPFNADGWMYIVNECNGYIPVRIKAVKEGTLVPVSNALVTIESTDPKVYWVVSWMETFLMKVWYPINVATRSYYVRKMLEQYAVDFSDQVNVAFQFHNFGDRGSSTVEAAAIGGMAQLTQFMGTDNFNSLRYAKKFYGSECAGYSIPASEHSTVSAWGRENEFEMIENYVETYKTSPIIACVMDTYNIFESVNFVTSGKMKEKIESDEYPVFVIRPDSGNAVEIISAIINTMEDNSVAFTENSKGYKIWNKYRIIWGDGINMETMDEILDEVTYRGYAPENIAFGSGGWLMQQHDRDTAKFAIKCSAVTVNGEMRDVYKDPITDHGKKSKKGVISLYKTKDGFFTAERNSPWEDGVREALDVVFENGKMKRIQTLDEIREITKQF